MTGKDEMPLSRVPAENPAGAPRFKLSTTDPTDVYLKTFAQPCTALPLLAHDSLWQRQLAELAELGLGH